VPRLFTPIECGVFGVGGRNEQALREFPCRSVLYTVRAKTTNLILPDNGHGQPPKISFNLLMKRCRIGDVVLVINPQITYKNDISLHKSHYLQQNDAIC
jgi:hypothetical protein